MYIELKRSFFSSFFCVKILQIMFGSELCIVSFQARNKNPEYVKIKISKASIRIKSVVM